MQLRFARLLVRGLGKFGPVVVVGSLLALPLAFAQTYGTSRAGNPIPFNSTPLTASAAGTTAATTATLAADTSGRNTYICGFSILSNATAAATTTATVTGVTGGTLSFVQFTAPLASGVGDLKMTFTPCEPSSANNTAISVQSGAPGSGGTVSVNVWGYQY